MAVGAFCFLLFFVNNPKGLVADCAPIKIFALNFFLFAPYLVFAQKMLVGAFGFKKIPASAAAVAIISEMLLVQGKLVGLEGSFIFEVLSNFSIILLVFFFLSVFVEFIVKKADGGRKN